MLGQLLKQLGGGVARLGLAAVLAAAGHRPLDRGDQVVLLVRLLDEIDRAELQRAHGRRDVTMAGEDDDRDRHAAGVELLEDLEARHVAHAKVEKDAAVVEHGLLEKFGAAGVDPRRVAVAAQQEAGGAANRRVIIHDVDYTGHCLAESLSTQRSFITNIDDERISAREYPYRMIPVCFTDHLTDSIEKRSDTRSPQSGRAERAGLVTACSGAGPRTRREAESGARPRQ
jgi:hypothetical protein